MDRLEHGVLVAHVATDRHAHPACQEVLYLLAGKLEHTLGDESVTMEAGDSIVVPPGANHNALLQRLPTLLVKVIWVGLAAFIAKDILL